MPSENKSHGPSPAILIEGRYLQAVVVQCLDAVDMAGHRMKRTIPICSSDDYSPAVASLFTRYPAAGIYSCRFSVAII